MTKLSKISTYDLRFPTSDNLDGSDAMNPDPDYSAAYLILETDNGLFGNGFAFTIGRGNDLCCRAIEALSSNVIGLELNWIRKNISRREKIGPEKLINLFLFG